MFTDEISDEELIFGEPIETIYGTIRFYSYKEYVKRLTDLSLISFSTLKFYYIIRSQLLEANAPKSDLIDLMGMKEIPLFDYVRMNPQVLEAYARVFGELISHENINYRHLDLYYEMEEEDFLNIRSIIMKMNMLQEERMSPSPRVQDRIDRGKKLKMRENGDAPTTESILTSIFVETGIPFPQLLEMTAYQLLAVFKRIHSFKNFDVSVLMATVAPDVEIQRWDENHENEIQGTGTEHAIDSGEFSKNIGGIFK